ncbi:MAG: alpha/beta hydrolase [Clostridia bacterium]|nr:alpha/beta hydrolase [Clostridia bacterium]
MYIFEPILRKNWENTEKMDAKRIASQTEPEGLTKILDIPYIDDGEKAHLLDIYYPEGTTEKLPVIIDIHGGGWMYGYKEINKNFCLKLSEKGFLIASINYRLAGGNIRFDDQIRDIFAALKWLSENLKNYPADLDNVFLAGDSAGGHFSCVTTAVNLNEEMQKDFGVEYCGLDFKAVAAICPAVDLLSPNLVMNINVPVLLGEKHRKSKYRKYLDVAQIISKDFPPYYVNTASGDFLRKQCYRLKELLDINKIEYKFHDFTEKENDKNLQHVFNVVNPFSPAGDQANTEIADFFKARMTTKAK